MTYEFKKLSDVNVIEEMKDGLNVLVEDAGEIVKIDSNSVISNEVALKSEVEALSEEMANTVSTERVQIATEFTVEDSWVNISDYMSAGIGLGKTYFITLDGVEYECEATPDLEYGGAPIVGPGDPFIIYGNPDGSGASMSFAKDGTHTVSIDTVEIPTNFIPVKKAEGVMIQATPAEGYSQTNRVFTLDKTFNEITSSPSVMLKAEIWLSETAKSSSAIFVQAGMNGPEMAFICDYQLNNDEFYHDCIIVKPDGTAIGKPFNPSSYDS